MKSRDTLKINDAGHLEIGGCDTIDLVRKYGTPLYVMDEDYIRKISRSYIDVLRSEYPDSLVCYASKAFSCLAIYDIVASEGLGADIVSGGELNTALKSGLNPDKMMFHGNNKTPAELQFAVDSGIGYIVLDSYYEIELLNKILKFKKSRQKVLVRVNPGIDAHTHHFIQTTRVDSKFGFSIADGSAKKVIESLMQNENLDFEGLHCHIGSQIFELKPFELAVQKMTDFMKTLEEVNVKVRVLNMGGGFGVTYTEMDKPLQPCEYVQVLVKELKRCLKKHQLPPPKLVIEPGRSIVGEAGITLYTVGAIKEIKDVKNYISIDGGMFDNPRYALYQAQYDAKLANRMRDPQKVAYCVAGKCCESGDTLIESINLPIAFSGDILAVFTTGAYNFSMASNYNRNLIPPVILCKNGESDYIVKPQSYEDLLKRDCYPKWKGEK